MLLEEEDYLMDEALLEDEDDDERRALRNLSRGSRSRGSRAVSAAAVAVGGGGGGGAYPYGGDDGQAGGYNGMIPVRTSDRLAASLGGTANTMTYNNNSNSNSDNGDGSITKTGDNDTSKITIMSGSSITAAASATITPLPSATTAMTSTSEEASKPSIVTSILPNTAIPGDVPKVDINDNRNNNHANGDGNNNNNPNNSRTKEKPDVQAVVSNNIAQLNSSNTNSAINLPSTDSMTNSIQANLANYQVMMMGRASSHTAMNNVGIPKDANMMNNIYTDNTNLVQQLTDINAMHINNLNGNSVGSTSTNASNAQYQPPYGDSQQMQQQLQLLQMQVFQELQQKQPLQQQVQAFNLGSGAGSTNGSRDGNGSVGGGHATPLAVSAPFNNANKDVITMDTAPTTSSASIQLMGNPLSSATPHYQQAFLNVPAMATTTMTARGEGGGEMMHTASLSTLEMEGLGKNEKGKDNINQEDVVSQLSKPQQPLATSTKAMLPGKVGEGMRNVEKIMEGGNDKEEIMEEEEEEKALEIKVQKEKERELRKLEIVQKIRLLQNWTECCQQQILASKNDATTQQGDQIQQLNPGEFIQLMEKSYTQSQRDKQHQLHQLLVKGEGQEERVVEEKTAAIREASGESESTVITRMNITKVEEGEVRATNYESKSMSSTLNAMISDNSTSGTLTPFQKSESTSTITPHLSSIATVSDLLSAPPKIPTAEVSSAMTMTETQLSGLAPALRAGSNVDVMSNNNNNNNIDLTSTNSQMLLFRIQQMQLQQQAMFAQRQTPPAILQHKQQLEQQISPMQFQIQQQQRLAQINAANGVGVRESLSAKHPNSIMNTITINSNNNSSNNNIVPTTNSSNMVLSPSFNPPSMIGGMASTNNLLLQHQHQHQQQLQLQQQQQQQQQQQ
uniref:Uncharacterized protein n=1 Tax=Polytomella parva TaxID=51329 RepID=A0A7S0UQN6_9CHLO|mmetsp:Transcript_14679/g.25831  ORF Transcript_14679/g.25831 Transcript_14679/m.25831 type:complete len:905 (+) Transcript_14679:243-2957(+)